MQKKLINEITRKKKKRALSKTIEKFNRKVPRTKLS